MLLAGIASLALVGGGCGASGHQSTGQIPDGRNQVSKSGAYLERYEEDEIICGVFPEAHVAKEFGLSQSAYQTEIAEAYAHAYSGELRQASYEGCLEGLHP